MIYEQNSTNINNITFKREIIFHPLQTADDHPKIYIDGNIELDNFPNKTGSGTFIDPYIIEDYNIDAGHVNVSCIEIRNTDKFLIIRDCTVRNSKTFGITIYNCMNVRIINCSAFNNWDGILLSNSDNNVISGNNLIASRLGQGIELEFSDYNNLTGNTIEHFFYNIYLWNSDNNNLINNIVSSYWTNICVVWFSTGNTLYNNNVSYADYGIHILYSSNDNILFNNRILYNDRGLDVGGVSSGNVIFLNNFSGNNINALTHDDYINYWDNGTIGNYWDNYGGKDANDDGIGDAPYNIPGEAGSVDNYPIWRDPPVLSIISPLPDEVFERMSPNFNISIDEGIADIMWYTLDYEPKKYIFTSNGTINQALWDTLEDRIVIITFFANDTAGNINSKSVKVIKDTTPPIITIISPLFNDIFGIEAPNFEISISEPNLDSIWYTIDGGLTNFSFSELISSIDQNAWNITIEGSVTIRFYAKDITGKIAFAEIIVVKQLLEQPRQPTQSIIVGYNLFLLISIICSILFILIIKKRVKCIHYYGTTQINSKTRTSESFGRIGKDHRQIHSASRKN